MDDYKTTYKDDLIQIGFDEDRNYYLTFIKNQIMIRFDFSEWMKLMTSVDDFRKGIN